MELIDAFIILPFFIILCFGIILIRKDIAEIKELIDKKIMKKLSVEEKAKAYDEALEKLRSLYDDYDTVSTLIDIKEELEHIFPELAESEDERIRKELIEFVKSRLAGFSECDKFIAWLEKQKETFTKKDVDDAYLKGISDAKQELEKQGEQSTTDKVEPKFKVGDVITPKDKGHEPWQITQVDISGKKYRFKDDYVIPFSQEDNYELVEQKPSDKVEPKFKKE